MCPAGPQLVSLSCCSAVLCCCVLRADFGLSTFIKPGQQLSEVCGTAYYMAPEVLLVSTPVLLCNMLCNMLCAANHVPALLQGLLQDSRQLSAT